MKISLAITCKNEHRLLRDNLRYHHFLGVEHIFVYDDGSDDGTPESVKDLEYVTLLQSATDVPRGDHPSLSRLWDNKDQRVSARQMINARDALERSMQKNFDWTLSVDADEFLIIDFRHTRRNVLKKFLKKIPRSIDQVTFSTLETCHQQARYANVLTDNTLFKFNTPELKHKLYDPYRDEIWELEGLYGQSMGKSAVRPNWDVRHNTPHLFSRLNGAPLTSIQKGFVAHFYNYDFDDFMKSQSNHKRSPDHYLSGGVVERQKRLWRDLANDSNRSEQSLLDYYQRWILFSADEIEKYRRRPKLQFLNGIRQAPIIEVTSLKLAMQMLDNEA